jgi:hypothetical protein
MKNINIYVDHLCKKFNIPIKDVSAHKCLCEYVENIIFNIVSIASIIALINNCKMINPKIIALLNKYIVEACSENASKSTKKTKGGGGSIVLPSEFYGIDSGRYATTNITPDVLTIDFNSTIMRPQIGGGKVAVNNPVMDAITEILSKHDLKASPAITKKLCMIIESYLGCLLKKLQESKSSVSATTIKKTIASSKIFNVFK